MRQVIIMQGVSGSGKSTVARRIRSEGPNRVIVSADDFFVELGQGTYKFDGQRLGEAHNMCFRRFIEYVSERRNEPEVVIVDNTNTVATDIAPYYQAASAFGWDVKILRVLCNSEVAALRNHHGVPKKTVDRMAANIISQRYPHWWQIEEVSGG